MTESMAGLANIEARARVWRRELHQIPETAFEEHETSTYVARVLRELGYTVTTGIGGTGLVGSRTRGSSGRAVGLRSELDGLALTEGSTSTTRPTIPDGCTPAVTPVTCTRVPDR